MYQSLISDEYSYIILFRSIESEAENLFVEDMSFDISHRSHEEVMVNFERYVLQKYALLKRQ